MPAQEMIELERRNLVAATHDDVLAPSDQLDTAVAVTPRQIAGAEVSVDERIRRQCRIVEIAEHAERRADAELAGLLAGRLRRDAEIDALGRHADGAEALRLVGRPQAEVAGAGLGRAIEVVER